MRTSAYCVTILLCLTNVSFIQARKGRAPCPDNHSVWDKWYDGCNWCVCTDDGPVCTDKTCYRIPADQCDPMGEKWRDGCYRCHCKESGIVCITDHRCVHAMGSAPFECDTRTGCICGIDGVHSCIADTKQVESISLGYPKRIHDNKYVSNVPLWSKDRHIALRCRDAQRWYAGTKRCFCPRGTRVPTCGDPRYVAHRVDGFRFKVAKCISDQQWDYNCRRCWCHMYGFGFCVRIPNCRRDNSYKNRHIAFKKECEAGSRWRDGCKYCRCTSESKIICDSSGCNFSGNIAETKVKVNVPGIILGEADIQLTGGGKSKDTKDTDTSPTKVVKILSNLPRFQIPPPHSFNMIRTFRNFPKPPAITVVMCEGKYKPGETFYDKCNLCECTSTGDSKCTAILCV